MHDTTNGEKMLPSHTHESHSFTILMILILEAIPTYLVNQIENGHTFNQTAQLQMRADISAIAIQ